MAKRIEYEQVKPDHRPDILGVLVGVLRFAIVIPGIGIGAILVLLAALVPIRIHSAPLASWATVGLSKLFVWLFGIRLVCSDVGTLRNHGGLIFINHLSYLDPIVVKALAPVRFLSTKGVRRLPIIGWIARSIGTVFVNRGSLRSRATSLVILTHHLHVRARPPIVLAPEGQIGPGGRVLPFRLGAFSIAAEANVPILPVVIQFDPLDDATWLKGEWIPQAAWRLAARTSPFTAYLTLLEPLYPTTEDDARSLAAQTEARFNRVLDGSVPPGP